MPPLHHHLGKDERPEAEKTRLRRTVVALLSSKSPERRKDTKTTTKLGLPCRPVESAVLVYKIGPRPKRFISFTKLRFHPMPN